MTAAELGAALQTVYETAYRQFKTVQEPPFICYYLESHDDLMADDENYLAIGDYLIELYTEDKDPTAEAAVEAKLTSLGLPFGKLETPIASEQLYQVLYSVRLI